MEEQRLFANNYKKMYNSLHLYRAFLAFLSTQSTLHCGWLSPRPPPVCNIHLDDGMAAIVR